MDGGFCGAKKMLPTRSVLPAYTAAVASLLVYPTPCAGLMLIICYEDRVLSVQRLSLAACGDCSVQSSVLGSARLDCGPLCALALRSPPPFRASFIRASSTADVGSFAGLDIPLLGAVSGSAAGGGAGGAAAAAAHSGGASHPTWAADERSGSLASAERCGFAGWLKLREATPTTTLPASASASTTGSCRGGGGAAAAVAGVAIVDAAAATTGDG